MRSFVPWIHVHYFCIKWQTCKIRHHVFTTFDARIRNVKCKNKNVLEILKSSKYISLFESHHLPLRASWWGSKSEIYFEDFKIFIFTFYISYTNAECGNDVMSYFASSSSYLNTFLVSAFTISQKSARLTSQKT